MDFREILEGKSAPDIDALLDKYQETWLQFAVITKPKSPAVDLYGVQLDPHRVVLAAKIGRISNAEVNLAVYENAKLPGVDIRVIHLRHKEKNSGSSVDITVIMEESD